MKKTKLAFFHSVIALLLCISMLIGTTFAWFTDSVTSTNNIIASGNLDVELEWYSEAVEKWLPVTETTNVFADDTLWEPGHTEVVYLRISNMGSLALKYQLSVNVASEVKGTNVYDKQFKLSDYIEMGAVKNATPTYATRDDARKAVTTSGTLASGYSTSGSMKAGDPAQYLALVVFMPETVGNEANYKTGTTPPEINLGITLLATQMTAENDSFGDDYDEDAKFPALKPGSITVDITGKVDSTTNTLTEDVTMVNSEGNLSAIVRKGTKVTGNSLTLSVSELSATGSNVTLEENEILRSLDVHIEGVAEDNTVPAEITVKEAMMKGLNIGNYALYHVEGEKTNEMTAVAAGALAAHNDFTYDPATGDVTLAMATFSEVTMVAEPSEWEGNFDYSWYDADATELTIANADQLAAFGAIVGGMAKDENGNFLITYKDSDGDEHHNDNFSGKTVKLLADVNLGDKDNANTSLIFHPIGYYYNGDSSAPYSTVYSFEGTFDGNGHTIANFYQNTWEIKGDYDGNYYKDAMGLFGYVVNGKVCNLTVDNFSSDGEFTPTGVIAAYAVNSTFENIAITNCNPRVYNTGNGGIVGIGGNSDDPDTYKLTFTNITIDNTNVISALWGSWDVACGGLVGMFRGNGLVNFTNCHVAAQIDVNNDVCANYQYYWYRYSGMMIGSIRKNVTGEDGYTYPDMTGISATDCTVHFGTWNDYYYCELVANSKASYTHDHQFSRLTEVDELPESAEGTKHYVKVTKDADGNVTNVECRHFIDGVLHTHDMSGTETVNGKTVDVEDKTCVYLPFDQLFTGYGWGVKSKGLKDVQDLVDENGNKVLDIVILDRLEGSSVDKFIVKEDVTSVSNGVAIRLDSLFSENTEATTEVSVLLPALIVSVTNLDDNGTVELESFERGTTWADSTIILSGKGNVSITIQDYYFCTPTTIEVTVTERQPVEKFDVVMNNGDFLHRVGNSGTVALDKLFKAKDGVTVGTVSVTVEAVDGTGASGTYSSNAIQFSGTGVVKVTIKDDDAYCKPTELYLEVVDATNVTSLSGTITSNVVLLNDCGLSSLTISGRYAVYGNGFTATYSGNGQYLNNGLKQGVITVSENGTLDNLRIVASIYPSAYLYYGKTELGEYVQGGPSSVEGDKTRYHYQLSAVAASGNATISNCYIYGGRNNIFINTGNVTITDTVLECGTVANVQIQSNSSHTVTFNNVTTIQYRVNATVGDTSAVMLGAGIIVGPETNDNPTIMLNGEFKQYNWINNDDASAVSSDTTKMIINGALDATDYNHSINGKKSSNLGIIYMNEFAATITNNTGLPYELGNVSMTVSSFTVAGKAYSLQGATETQIYSDYENADRSTVNGLYVPQFKYDSTLGNQYVAEGGDEHCYREGDTINVMFPSGGTKEIDLAALVNIAKYTGQDLNLVIAVKDSNGNAITVTDGKITLSTAEVYTVTYIVTDTLFYDKDGETVSKTIEYSWNVTVSVSLKDAATPDAYFDFVTENQKMGYYKPVIGDVKQYLPFLAGLKIHDYNGQTSYLRFDGDNDFNKVASITITQYVSNEAYLEIKLTDGGVIKTKFLARADSGGASTYTGSIKTSNNTIYFVNDGGTSNKEATTTAAYWYVDYYKFTGNNGVEITSAQQTFISTGSSASTPSGSFSTTINYTVSYDANGGNCGQTTGYATSVSATVTLPTPTRSGYIFAGWHTAASGGTRVGGAGESYTPSANITLYAQWGTPCTVTYNANGGSCDTTSEKYTGTALTLPTATREGYWFIGWYDAATGGNKIGDAGATYNPSGEITLYAHWQEKVEYTVTYNANGGTCGTTSATYQGTALTLPTPTRTGYTFNGWYTAASGGTKIGDAGASYTPSANITLYAQWQINSYTITVTTNNATVKVNGTTVNNNGTVSIQYGTQVTVEVAYSESNNQSTTITGTDGTTYTSPFTMPAQNVTINATSSGSCFTPDTLITLADGTQKRVDELTFGDKILAWDFFAGTYVEKDIALLVNHGEDLYRIANLQFSDGTILRIIAEHGVFDYDLNKYVYFTVDNMQEYVGHRFVQYAADGSYNIVTLTNAYATEEYTSAWSVSSAGTSNAFASGLLTVAPPEDFYNWIEMGDKLMYDVVQFQQDVETYGLYTYEDFADYVTYEQFIAWNGAYLKIAVEKGYFTFEYILELIELYKGWMPNN